MTDINLLVEFVFWPSLFMGVIVGLGVATLLKLRPRKGY